MASSGRTSIGGDAIGPAADCWSRRSPPQTVGLHSGAFAWAYVGIDAIAVPAQAVGFTVAERWQDQRLWFARLVAAC